MKALLWVNKRFKLPQHPFNMRNNGEKTYAMWQYEKGIDTVKSYLKFTDSDAMFKDKVVLDIGCGAAGKSLFYANCGAEKVYGLDILPQYKDESETLAKQLNLQDKFEFVLGDAAKMDFPDNSFDTIIMNDAMEHVDEPEKVLEECARVLKKGGKLFVNFPPYNHPFGAHLSDAVAIPWVHLFFSEQTLINGYKELVKDLPDGEARIKFRIATDKNGKEYFSYINKMTLKRFKKIKENLTAMQLIHYSEEPLRPVVSLLAKMPVLKEGFVRMAVCVFEK